MPGVRDHGNQAEILDCEASHLEVKEYPLEGRAGSSLILHRHRQRAAQFPENPIYAVSVKPRSLLADGKPCPHFIDEEHLPSSSSLSCPRPSSWPEHTVKHRERERKATSRGKKTPLEDVGDEAEGTGGKDLI